MKNKLLEDESSLLNPKLLKPLKLPISEKLPSHSESLFITTDACIFVTFEVKEIL